MRSLLLIGLLIVHSANCQGPTNELYIGKVNGLRSVYAQLYQQADMNELVYREDLEQLIANQLAKSNGCPDSSIVKRDGYHIILNYEGELKYTVITQSGSTVLAATTTTCPENGETVVGIIVDGADTEPVRGAAGTHCPVGRTRNPNGLCALVGNGRRGYVRKDIDVKIPTTIIETGIRVPHIWFPKRVPDDLIPEIPDDIKILDLPDVFPW